MSKPVKAEKHTYTMNPEECHECIMQDKTIDLNKDDYIRRELDGKLVFFHSICYKDWKKKH